MRLPISIVHRKGVATDGNNPCLLYGYPTDELTTDARDWIDKNFPLPPDACLADLDGNGTVGVSDLLALLANWGPCP